MVDGCGNLHTAEAHPVRPDPKLLPDPDLFAPSRENAARDLKSAQDSPGHQGGFFLSVSGCPWSNQATRASTMPFSHGFSLLSASDTRP